MTFEVSKGNVFFPFLLLTLEFVLVLSSRERFKTITTYTENGKQTEDQYFSGKIQHKGWGVAQCAAPEQALGSIPSTEAKQKTNKRYEQNG